MDAARKLNVSLLTVSPVSHSVSHSGVLSLFPACNQFLCRLWFVGRCMMDCSITLFVDETSKLSELFIVCCGVSFYCYRSCSFSADHGPKPRPCSKSLFAEPKGEASNRDALSSHVCMYVCIYVYPSQSTRDT